MVPEGLHLLGAMAIAQGVLQTFGLHLLVPLGMFGAQLFGEAPVYGLHLLQAAMQHGLQLLRLWHVSARRVRIWARKLRIGLQLLGRNHFKVYTCCGIPPLKRCIGLHLLVVMTGLPEWGTVVGVCR